MKRMRIALAAMVVGMAGAGGAAASEATLRAVSFAPPGTPFSFEFERFIERVNETGAGQVRIELLGGGPQVMPELELGNAVRGGVIDLMIAPGAFYTNLVPEANAIKLSEYSPAEERENGVRELLNRIHNEKMNAELLATLFHCSGFHLYLNKRIETPDLTDLRLRASKGAGQALFRALGATTMMTPPGAVFTALERGTIDGYGWPLEGVPAFGLQKVTKYRVDPGLYKTTVALLANSDRWQALDDAQRGIISDAAAWAEDTLCQTDSPMRQRALQMQTEAGIEVITFSPGDERDFLHRARETAWEDVIADSPEYGPQLKDLLTR